MSDGEEQANVKGDPNPSRLMERVMAKLDGVLFAHGLEFKDDAMWAEAVIVMEKYIFHFYDDLTGGDEDYDPRKPADSDSGLEGEAEVEGAASADEEEEAEDVDSDEEAEDSEEAAKETAAKKRKINPENE